MNEPTPMKGAAIVPTITIRMDNWQTLHLQIDLRQMPSQALALAVLEKAARQLRNEESNASSVAYMERIAQEQMEQQALSAITNQRKQ